VKFIFRTLHAGSAAADFDQHFNGRVGEFGLVLVGHGGSIKETRRNKKLFLHLFLFIFFQQKA
jgi:hypothetical protein